MFLLYCNFSYNHANYRKSNANIREYSRCVYLFACIRGYFTKLAKNDANPKTGRANIKTCKPLTNAGTEITNGKT